MRLRTLLVSLLTFLCFTPRARAGEETINPCVGDSGALAAPSFEIAAESSYLSGSLANPNSYEVAAQFLTARWRWGTIQRESWLRGYNQVYFLAMGESILRGPENYYFGVSAGFRYNFVQPGWRLHPYISGGVGLGWIDSHAEIPGGQGQDFTFNVLSAVGVSYQVNDHLKVNIGGLYQHLSNAGLTDPNPSLNLFGPQLGVTYSF